MGDDIDKLEQRPAASAASPTETIAERYVAFCDLLGFGARIAADFDKALEAYRDFSQLLVGIDFTQVELTIYSDAVLMTSETLPPLLWAANGLWFAAMSHDLMVRGAITKGRVWQRRQGNHFFVVSDALVRAVKLEQSIGVPAIFVADDIEISDDYWMSRFARGLLSTPLLHFRDRNIVNPFGRYWFASAGVRASQLMTASPAHRDKYLWFLALFEAAQRDDDLVPPSAVERLISSGFMRRTPPPADAPV